MRTRIISVELDPRLTLWRYMKISTFFLLLEGVAFFPSVATLKTCDPLEGDLHPGPKWLVGKLQDLSEDTFDQLTKWLFSKGEDWERSSLQVND